MKRRNLLLCALVAVGLLDCTGAHSHGVSGRRAMPRASAAATGAVSPPAARHYVRGSRAVAVVDEPGPFDAKASVSPDGLLVALHPQHSPAMVFYDIDRRRIVGRSASAPAILNANAPTWVHEHLLVDGYSTEVLFDAKDGAFVGQVERGAHVAIATKQGLATLAVSTFDDSADLVLFGDPTRTLAHIETDGRVEAVYDLGDGAFAYLGLDGLHAFEANGTPRGKRTGKGVGALSASAAQVAPHRVTIAREGLFEPGHDAATGVPLVRFDPGKTTRVIEWAGGSSFAARCQNGASATLGPVRSLPAAFAPVETSACAEQALVSKGGAYRVAWTVDELTVTDVASSTTTVLDVGNYCVQADFHPNGKSLITAAHLSYLGMGFHTDPEASVRVFDLATGALTKKLAGDGFSFSDDKTKLIVRGREEVNLYDAATYQKLRTWRGIDIEVSLDPTNRFAFVKRYRRPEGGLGPNEPQDMFVEVLAQKRRLVSLKSTGGFFAFDAKGGRFAFAAESHEFDDNIRTVTTYDLAVGIVSATVSFDEPIARIAFLGGGEILSVSADTKLVLHRLEGGQRVTLHAVPDANECRLFALDQEGHFQGEPGAKLAFRYGDDLRTSEVVAASDEPARHDERLLQQFFADR